MKLFILRHGIAEDKLKWAPRDDRTRPLTKKGKRKVKLIAKRLRRLDLELDRILTSPYERALQTAHLLARALKMKKNLEIWPELKADQTPQKLLRRLAGKTRWGSVLLVGHEPYLSRLIGILTAGKPDARLVLKKSGLSKLTTIGSLRRGHRAKLEWLIPPKIFEAL